MMAKTQLLLLDDHTLFREMLSRWLDSDPAFHVVAHCSSTPAALEALARHRVDLVLLDYDLGPRETGFQFIEQARAAGYSGRILLVTAGMTEADSLRALGLGASGIFLKHSSPELLAEAIRKVIGGETWIDQRCLQALVQAVSHSRPEPARPPEITERERQVLQGVFAGCSNKEIGVQLHLSEASVKSALQQLFLKTGVRTRSQLVRVALEEYGALWRLHTP
ncbi:MAG: response regulator transcription factor [Acidobacteriaceae bacterium]|nr:response regulator transcription factor [Acidobacteriaceae bacterium]